MASSRDHRCCDNSLLTVTAAERCAEWIFRLIGHSASLAQLRGLAGQQLQLARQLSPWAQPLHAVQQWPHVAFAGCERQHHSGFSDWAGHVYLVNVSDLQAMTPGNIVECSHDTYLVIPACNEREISDMGA